MHVQSELPLPEINEAPLRPVDIGLATVALGVPYGTEWFDANANWPVKVVAASIAAASGIALYLRARRAGL